MQGSAAIRIAAALFSARSAWVGLWVLVAALVALLYLLPETKPPGAYEFDKGAHLIAFAAIGFPAWFIARRRRAFLLLVSADLALGITLEFLQASVPGRDFSHFDMLANVVGIAIGATLGIYMEQIFARWLLTVIADPRRTAASRAIRAE